MITVCLLGSDIAKEQALLQSQSDIRLIDIDSHDGDDILATLARIRPAIFIIADDNEHIDADELCLLTHLRVPQTRTLIITRQEADYERLQASGYSCRGYVMYEQRHAIVRAVRVVNDGESWLSRKLITDVLDRLAASALDNPSRLQLVNNT